MSLFGSAVRGYDGRCLPQPRERPGFDDASREGPASGAQPVQVSRFVRETLEAYASEEVADRITRSALGLAGLGELPTTGAALAAFVEGPLLDVARESLGYAQADQIAAQLAGLVHVVEQMERARGGAGAKPCSTVPPPVAVSSPAPAWDAENRAPTLEIALKPFAVVLVIGHDPDAVAQMKPFLDPRTAAIPVEGARELVRDLRLLRQQARMLIVDQRRPHRLLDAVRSEPALLEGAALVLWGATREDELEAKRTFSKASIVRCGADVTAQDLASIVRLGPGR